MTAYPWAYSFASTDTVEVVRLHEIREYFISQFLKLIRALSLSDRVAISGGATNTKVAPHIVHIVVRGIESDHLVLSLDSYGVYVSSQTTCKSGKSHGEAIRNLFNLKETDGTLRFSFGKSTTKRDVDHAIESLGKSFQKICELEKLLTA